MSDFTKIIHPIDCDCRGNGRYYPVFCEILYYNVRLSISGVIGPTRYGNAMGSCGQINGSFTTRTLTRTQDSIRFVKGWNRTLWYDFLDAWDLYHLNDMHAGCEHQRALHWENDGYDKHPSEPCPTCGYQYGTSWNFIPVPETVLDFLKNLPVTDRTPAWV